MIEEIKEVLVRNKEELREKFKVKGIGFFGSYVRGEYEL
ncbi:nucleotidyltransferase domain-containing protein [Candidatus Aerophobetes bacterium]|nr:nucleotidyltransferase domain-containing protein [Candidatus Aerophobetes bacterium]